MRRSGSPYPPAQPSRITPMRTTLDIDDDVLIAARELARRERKTTGQVLTELARWALAQPHPAAATPAIGAEPEGFLGFRPFPSRGGIVTTELINELRGGR